MSWMWRTKPRSIIRTVQWFKFFSQLEGKNWNQKDDIHFSKHDNKKIRPIRRQYIYNAHSGEDLNIGNLTFQQYLSGLFDKNETESNGRNDKTTFEFFGFGYVNKDGIINVTKVGNRISDEKFNAEDFLKQMLKLQFPNPVSDNLEGFEKDKYIFPLELLCRAINKFDYLNRSEIALLFGCTSINDFDKAYFAIEHFRKQYKMLTNKNDIKKVKKICAESYLLAYGKLENKIDTYYEYAEAFCRCLVYTGIFKMTGRSLASKIKVPEYSQLKFKMILDNHNFEKKQFNNLDEYMLWYGDTDSVVLPWDNYDLRKEIVEEKIKYINELSTNNDFIKNYDGNIETAVRDIICESQEILSKDNSITTLKDVENNLVNFIIGIYEREYIEKLSKTSVARKEILDKYDEILDTIDMGALWLEVNTWKSLVAISGDKIVKRNFNIEEDLTPRSFAPGIGNTPDMELYTDEYIIIPEVSLMSGTKQWEHEGSSVIDHVLSFINDNKDKKVRGLFITNALNIRTKWQFFILNRESWVGNPVPVIPLTIKQYKSIITVFYEKNLDILEFIGLLEQLQESALISENYDMWFDKSNQIVQEWIEQSAAS